MSKTCCALATALVVALGTAASAAAHSEYPPRPPTAKERAQFEKRRSAKARAAAARVDASQGSFSAPFTEPTLTDGRATDQDCVTNEDGSKTCKPAAGTMNLLPSGKILYWNALEGTENIKTSIVDEYGAKSINDQSRLLDLSGPSW